METSVTSRQDYFAIFGHLQKGNLHKSIKNLPKQIQKFVKHGKIAKDFNIFSKVAEFRQIWSH